MSFSNGPIAILNAAATNSPESGEILPDLSMNTAQPPNPLQVDDGDELACWLDVWSDGDFLLNPPRRWRPLVGTYTVADCGAMSVLDCSQNRVRLLPGFVQTADLLEFHNMEVTIVPRTASNLLLGLAEFACGMLVRRERSHTRRADGPRQSAG